ncbi:MAG: hypothetical protein J6A83_03125 [Clostridia bacterium]|nr:hypothetical protein [Clostridia bacterium]
MKKKQKGLWLVYTERIAPIVSHILLVILMFIPSVQYSINNEKRQVLSPWELLGTCWAKTREYLFSASSQQTSEGKLFQQAVLVTVIILVLLFLIGIAVSIWASFVSLRYYKDKTPSEEAEKAKNIFTAIIPNRFVLSLLRVTAVPLFFFPDILVILYRRLLLYDVSVDFTLIHCGIIALLLFVAVTVITIISAKYEKRLNMNIFAKRKVKDSDDEEEYDEDGAEGDEKPTLRHMQDESVQEQTERLRGLLGYSENDNKTE